MTGKELIKLKMEYDALMEKLSGLGEAAFGYVTGEPLYEGLSYEELETAANDTSWWDHNDVNLFRTH